MVFRSKKPILQPFWVSFFPEFGQQCIFLAKSQCLYECLKIPIIHHHAKIQKKLMTHSWEESQTEARTDRRTDNGDFIGPSVGRRSKIKQNNCVNYLISNNVSNTEYLLKYTCSNEIVKLNKIYQISAILLFNSFLGNAPFLYLLKASEFPLRYGKRTLTWKGLS